MGNKYIISSIIILSSLISFNAEAKEIESFDIWKVNGFKTEITKEQTASIYEQIAPELIEDYDIDWMYKWIDGNKNLGLMTSTTVAVHEETHVYAHPDEEANRNIQGLYIEFNNNSGSELRIKAEDKVFKIKTFDPFNSASVKKYIPKKFKDLRFIAYLEGPNHDSNTLGIFGLLDEYNAFNKEVQYLIKLESIVNRDNINIYRYKKLFSEFRYMMLTYLLYAEEHRPEQFDKFMGNEELRKAYTSVNNEVIMILEQLELMAEGNDYALQVPEINELLKDIKYIEMHNKFKLN